MWGASPPHPPSKYTSYRGPAAPGPLLYTPQTLKTLIPNFNVIATASYLMTLRNSIWRNGVWRDGILRNGIWLFGDLA